MLIAVSGKFGFDGFRLGAVGEQSRFAGMPETWNLDPTGGAADPQFVRGIGTNSSGDAGQAAVGMAGNDRELFIDAGFTDMRVGMQALGGAAENHARVGKAIDADIQQGPTAQAAVE